LCCILVSPSFLAFQWNFTQFDQLNEFLRIIIHWINLALDLSAHFSRFVLTITICSKSLKSVEFWSLIYIIFSVTKSYYFIWNWMLNNHDMIITCILFPYLTLLLVNFAHRIFNIVNNEKQRFQMILFRNRLIVFLLSISSLYL